MAIVASQLIILYSLEYFVDLSIVVPTYREAGNVEALTGRIRKALELTGLKYEVIFVDDDSRDGIDEKVTALHWEGAPVTCVVRTEDRGLSKSVLHGFRKSKGKILLCMDADLSHPPEAIPKFVERLNGDADFVIGSRYVPGGGVSDGWTPFRWLNSMIATVLSFPLHGGQVKDPMAGFFALRKETFEAAEKAGVNPIGWKIGLELLVKANCKAVQELPIHFEIRHEGESKLNLRHQLEFLKHLAALYRFKFPILSILLPLAMLGGIGYAIYRCVSPR
jgi:dolichol-phosphate mannosyltransferase